MANFDTIKTAIDANINTNGTQDITGGKMNSILKQMVDATGEQLTELESRTLNNCFIGKGETFSRVDLFGLIPNNTYRVYLDKTSWDIPVIADESKVMFAISYIKDSVEYSLDRVLLNNPIVEPYYDITLPSEFDSVLIGGRAAEGVKIGFNVVDISIISTIASAIEIQQGGYLDSEGKFVSDSNYFVTPSIPIQIGDVIEWHGGFVESDVPALVAFDGNGQRVDFKGSNTDPRTILYEQLGSNPVSIRCNMKVGVDGVYVKVNANTEFFIGLLDRIGKAFDKLKTQVNTTESRTTELESRTTELESRTTELESVDAYSRYITDSDAIYALSRKGYGASSNKDFVLGIVTDTHNYNQTIKNAINICDNIEVVDILAHLGDGVGSHYTPSEANAFVGELLKSAKPIMPVIGNHDVGMGYYVGYGASHKQAFDSYIAPFVNKGWINTTKPYYYKDVDERKLRIIALYEYDSDLAIDETIWEVVAYDSSASMINASKVYNGGDIVNVPNYTDGSFRAKTTIDMNGASIWNKAKYPSYKFQRGFRCIRKEQAEWLANTLLSTPNGYRVVILMHNPFSSNATNDKTKLFAMDVSVSASASIQNIMQTDLVADMVEAFRNRTTYEVEVKMQGDGAYMNTIQGTNGLYAYSLSVDFSSVSNDVNFLCYLGGHCHHDYIFRHNIYNQIGINAMASGFQEITKCDIIRKSTDGYGYDSLTFVGFDTEADKVKLAKVGQKRVIDGRVRDFEIL